MNSVMSKKKKNYYNRNSKDYKKYLLINHQVMKINHNSKESKNWNKNSNLKRKDKNSIVNKKKEGNKNY